ncbi:hypothetical protein PUN28_004406 [Cardiocondyla obscurior]|uniref:Uncharacterized protein n=1 Tax=Cardiocondyla obscurior TaxID=286306 RepID=A0AAW2GCD7_9HYME
MRRKLERSEGRRSRLKRGIGRRRINSEIGVVLFHQTERHRTIVCLSGYRNTVQRNRTILASRANAVIEQTSREN